MPSCRWKSASTNSCASKGDKRHLKVHFVFIPVAREALLTSLIEGKGDIAAANLTITDKRKKQGIAFTDPLLENVRGAARLRPPLPKVESAADLGASASSCAPPPATTRACSPPTRPASRRESPHRPPARLGGARR